MQGELAVFGAGAVCRDVRGVWREQELKVLWNGPGAAVSVYDDAEDPTPPPDWDQAGHGWSTWDGWARLDRAMNALYQGSHGELSPDPCAAGGGVWDPESWRRYSYVQVPITWNTGILHPGRRLVSAPVQKSP